MDIDYDEQSALQARFHVDDRMISAKMIIDLGFVHQRKILAFLGPRGLEAINSLLKLVPADLPDWQARLQTSHAYARLLVDIAGKTKTPSLGLCLARPGTRAFSSVETVAATPGVYDEDRVVTRVLPKHSNGASVTLEYSTRHIVADTLRLRLSEGAELAIIAAFLERRKHDLVFEPLLIGTPMIERDGVETDPVGMWLGYAFGEIYPEDIDEFQLVSQVPVSEDWSVMQRVSEKAFKTCIAQLLGEEVPTDWGGEQSDLYSAHLHVGRQRMPTAFLLKGPARFAPMTLNTLGKNNDQIVRLAQRASSPSGGPALSYDHASSASDVARFHRSAWDTSPPLLPHRRQGLPSHPDCV